MIGIGRIVLGRGSGLVEEFCGLGSEIYRWGKMAQAEFEKVG
ncbi:hypothetical protein [Staphylococcus epidermidis]|nr:hypothetical protein [Staphylococcus epidermidis]